MTAVFRVHPPRRRRLWVTVLIAVALLIVAGARWLRRKLRPSGDSDDRPLRDVTVPIRVTRLCSRSGCTNPVSERALYCSHACRQAGYRERKAAV